jgi:hypothetical protein
VDGSWKKSVENKLGVITLPNHWAERLHHGSVMGGEVTRRGTRGTHSESAEVKVGSIKVNLVREVRVVLPLSWRGDFVMFVFFVGLMCENIHASESKWQAPRGAR